MRLAADMDGVIVRPRDYRRMAVVGLLFAAVLFNLWALGSTWYYVVGLGGGGVDWQTFERAAGLIAGGTDPYTAVPAAPHLSFRWSPLMAWAFVPLTALGFWPWVGAHLLAVAGFANWRLSVLVLLSWPFVIDTVDGGAMMFLALAAWWAYRGSRVGTAAFLVLAILIPRPLMLPLVAWIVWQRPEWRVPFVVLLCAHAITVVAMGWHIEWAARLLTAGQDIGNVFNFAPSRWIGAAWFPIGLALGAWLTYRGRIGWASLAISPYLLPPYALMLVLEWRPGYAAQHHSPRERRLIPE